MGTWISLDIDAQYNGPVRGRAVIRDPDPDFMQALTWALVNRVLFPLPPMLDAAGFPNGVVLTNVDTRPHDESTIFGVVLRWVEVTIEFLPVP